MWWLTCFSKTTSQERAECFAHLWLFASLSFSPWFSKGWLGGRLLNEQPVTSHPQSSISGVSFCPTCSGKWQMLYCHFSLSEAGESLSSTWKYSMFFYQSKTHSPYLHKCFIVPSLLPGIVKRQEFSPQIFPFSKVYLAFQIKYKFRGFELHNQFWVEWNINTPISIFLHVFVYIFMIRHSAKICVSGRTWSSRSCQNQYGPGRGTALKAWVMCSTCPRSTSKMGPQRWATDHEGCSRVAESLFSSLLLLNFFL